MRAGLVAAVLLCASARAADQRFLTQLSVDDAAGVKLAPGAAFTRGLELNGMLRPSQAAELATRWRLSRPSPTELRFVYRDYPSGDDPVTERERTASFLVDFDEPVFAKVRADVEQKLGKTPTPEALARYVDAFIHAKDYTRGYDVASRVATKREGDCTEHAVLLAALLRMLGTPARVVNGVVLLSHGGQIAAFGHAWVEQHAGKRWERIDALAADISEASDAVIYVPLEVVADEGPGFAFKMLSGLSPMQVRRIVLSPAPTH